MRKKLEEKIFAQGYQNAKIALIVKLYRLDGKNLLMIY
jgi:hypothetical protein